MGARVYKTKDEYFNPVFPCRVLETRACPAIYNDICRDNPCARFESEDVSVWIVEIMDDM